MRIVTISFPLAEFVRALDLDIILDLQRNWEKK